MNIEEIKEDEALSLLPDNLLILDCGGRFHVRCISTPFKEWKREMTPEMTILRDAKRFDGDRNIVLRRINVSEYSGIDRIFPKRFYKILPPTDICTDEK